MITVRLIEIADRILMLKVQLILQVEKLLDKDQQRFAERLHLSVSNLSVEADEMAKATDIKVMLERAKSVVQYLGEIENILLACQVGIGLPSVEKVMPNVRGLKTEINNLITQGVLPEETTRE